MATVSFGTFSKRRNSTKQPTTLSDQRTVMLKNPTSQDRPVFVCTGNNFNYNYCSWDGKYYFIDEIISLINNEIEIHCVMDALATYKAEILASTQFVSYSSQSGNAWLADTRIPLLASETVSTDSSNVTALDPNGDGFYVLSVVGKESSAIYELTLTNLKDVIQSISNWETTGIQTAEAYITTTTDPATAVSNIGKALVHTGFIGNAYSQSPSCIRSCIWVPFAYAVHDGSDYIYLGNFNTGVLARKLSAKPTSNSFSISIPWQHSDWRRKTCEEVYLYLPLVGMVNLASDEIINVSTLTIKWSLTAADGVLCYEVLAGSQIIGTYSTNAAVNYPIGINQQASAGEIFQSYLTGITKTVSAGMETAKASASLNPISSGIGVAAGGINTALTGIQSAYDIMNTHNTSHASCIGSLGGGAGLGLDTDAVCFTVSHDTIINPSDMQATMGLPTMKPMALATLTGFCQCANAHIEAPATAGELDAIDSMLNSGFYIE